MKYLPTINIWEPAIHRAIVNGQLKLQVGQWVMCGREGVKSRFIDIHNGIFNVAHGGNTKEVTKRFNSRIAIRKETIARWGHL